MKNQQILVMMKHLIGTKIPCDSLVCVHTYSILKESWMGYQAILLKGGEIPKRFLYSRWGMNSSSLSEIILVDYSTLK